jgi:hypothetical protein
MAKRHVSRRRAPPLARQAAELAVAVPQVMAHRLTRMALAGPQPSRRDRVEFTRMVAEKPTAFALSGWAVAVQGAMAWQAMVLQAMQSLFTPWWLARPFDHRRHADDLLAHAVAPLHRAATANARRLARTRLR